MSGDRHVSENDAPESAYRRFKDPDVMRSEFDARAFDMTERLAALRIAEAMEGLSAAERARILRWAFERFVPPHQRRPGDPVPSLALTPSERAALAAAIERDEDAGVSDYSIGAVEGILATRVIPPSEATL